ncbi:MAG: hypothetical protein RIR69_1320 [Actinomycetota bacterium]|jgi:hypothetical protein
MEQSLRRSHQFFPLTTNKFSSRHHSPQQHHASRGNVAVLSVVWCALTVFGCVALVRATHITVVKGNGQFMADAIALTYADRGATSANTLARALGVSIEKIDTSGNGVVTVEVRGQGFYAISSAS